MSRNIHAAAPFTPPLQRYAQVVRSVGLLLETEGVDAGLGTLCQLLLDQHEVPCEVVGFSGNRSQLMPLAPVSGVQPGTLVRIDQDQPAGRYIPQPETLLGRVVNGLCQPVDGLGVLGAADCELCSRPINPLARKPIDQRLEVGVAAIDGLLCVGQGQRLGLFAGSGVGKSVLLGMLARYVQADVVVVGLIGERGREVQEFIVDNLGSGLQRAVVVASPADDSPALRIRGAMLATQIAEQFRDQGLNVLLLMDSLTRVAQAQREIGLSLGEPPTTKGYTPSAFACLPKLVERAGTSEHGGSVTAFYTVLMEEDDLQDPVVDAARAILDGHIVLSRELADQGVYPAIDVGRSVSRLMQKLADQEQKELAHRFRSLWQCYREQEDLIHIGAYQQGSDALIDEAILRHPLMLEFVKQDDQHRSSIAESRAALTQLFSSATAATSVVTV